MPADEPKDPVSESEEEPRLLAEIAKTAILMLKAIFAVCAPILAIILLLRNHPVAAMVTIYALFFFGLVIFFGYQSYQWKKNDLEWKRRWKEQDEQWARRQTDK